MGLENLLKPVPDRDTPDAALARVKEHEAAAAVFFAEGTPWGDRDYNTSLTAFSFPDHFAAVILDSRTEEWANPFIGRYSRLTNVKTIGLDIGDDDGERIDSSALRKALVALVNVEEVNKNKSHVLINGTSGVAWNEMMLASVPLQIECLAEATRGGYVMLHRQIARLVASVIMAAEYRHKHGLPGGDVTVRAVVVDDGKRLLLNVSTSLVRVLIEQIVEVRPYFDTEKVNRLLMHEPTVLADFATLSARRAARASAKQINRPDLIERAVDETVAHTAIFAGTSGLSIARLDAHKNETKDTEDWPFRLVPGASVTTSGKAWQVIAGAVFEILPSVADTMTVGLTDDRKTTPLAPVVFFTDDGTVVAAMTAYAEPVA